MRSNRKNGDYFSRGAIIPEDSICGGSISFCIRFIDLFSLRSFDTLPFMGLETIMPGIDCQELDGFFNSFVALLQGRIAF